MYIFYIPTITAGPSGAEACSTRLGYSRKSEISIFLGFNIFFISQKNLRSQKKSQIWKKSQISQKFSKKNAESYLKKISDLTKILKKKCKISDLTKIPKKNADSYLKKISDLTKILKKKCRSLKKKSQKFGRFRIGNRVGFVGWLVGWLDGKEIFEYTSDRNGPKTRATRGQASLRLEK